MPPGMRGYQRMMEVDRAARLGNQKRLRTLSLAAEGEVRMFCAHDPVEFESSPAPAERVLKATPSRPRAGWNSPTREPSAPPGS